MALPKNYMHVNAISDVPPTDEMTIQLADDTKEVRGFGKPISTPVMRGMTDLYLDEFKKAAALVDVLGSDPKYNTKPEFSSLRLLIDFDNHVASGVFGKEIILQILAQRNCEGIRYVFGLDDQNKNSVILFGVTQVKDAQGQDVFTKRTLAAGTVDVAVSKPLANKAVNDAGDDGYGKNDINGEVHDNSRSLSEIQKEMDAKAEFNGSYTDYLLGEY